MAITVQVLDPVATAYVGEPFPIQLLIACESLGQPTTLRGIGSTRKSVELDADLFERDVTLSPGEVYRCTVVARFLEVMSLTSSPLLVTVGFDADSHTVPIPIGTVEVAPSLRRELRTQANAICTYEQGTKVDVTITHVGYTKFSDLRLTVGPEGSVSAGVTDRRRLNFGSGERIEFTTVVVGNSLALELEAVAEGRRVGPVTIPVLIPPVRDAEAVKLFRFLEPKKLTQAQVRIFTTDEERTAVAPLSGQFALNGGGERYRIEVRPAHPHPLGVKLRGLSGLVEVTEMSPFEGTWAFQVVVVSNAVFTTNAALHFDVLTSDGPQQGEIALIVRPKASKVWIVATTAGAAVTVKGVAALLPAIFSPSDPWSALQAAFLKVNTLWDLVQFLSIPLIRVSLWVADRLLRPLQDD